MPVFNLGRKDKKNKKKQREAIPAVRVVDKPGINDIDYKVLCGVLTDLDQIRLTAAQLNDRRIAYNAMTQLKSDAIIGPTIEIYATNATCTNPQGHVIWATAKDSSPEAIKAAKAANHIIDLWKLDWRAYSHMIELVTYGNLYLKTTEFVKPKKKGNDSPEAVINLNQRNPNKHWDVLTGSAVDPSIIYELRKDDEPAGFVVDFGQETNSYTQWCVIRGNRWAVESSDSCIHIVYNLSLYSNSLEVEEDGGELNDYDIYEGTPPFVDAYTPAQILSLLEDALVANRVTRSALLRILQIEIGDSSPQEEDRILDKLQRNMEHKLAADTKSGSANSYADPGPMEKIIYTATRNGKGAISVQTLGGDVNVRDIVDLDYYKDKITSITDVSPGNLGQSTDESGTGGATILIQNNIRLYRKVRSLQHAYAEGIRYALNLYFEKNELSEYKDLFDVHMQPPVGPEDQQKSDLANNALTRANDIIALLENLGIKQSEIKIAAVQGQLNEVDPNIYNLIHSVKPEDIQEESEESEENMFT